SCATSRITTSTSDGTSARPSIQASTWSLDNPAARARSAADTACFAISARSTAGAIDEPPDLPEAPFREWWMAVIPASHPSISSTVVSSATPVLCIVAEGNDERAVCRLSLQISYRNRRLRAARKRNRAAAPRLHEEPLLTTRQRQPSDCWRWHTTSSAYGRT